MTRPTPEQLADEFHYDSPLAFLRHLHEHGYRIVRPDDEAAVFQLAIDAGIIVPRAALIEQETT